MSEVEVKIKSVPALQGSKGMGHSKISEEFTSRALPPAMEPG
jgi:hypothetical protein